MEGKTDLDVELFRRSWACELQKVRLGLCAGWIRLILKESSQLVGTGVDELPGEFDDAGGSGGFWEVEAEAAEHGPLEAKVFGADIGEAELKQDAGGRPDGDQMGGATSVHDGGAVFAEDFLIHGVTCASKQEVSGLGAAFAKDGGETPVEVVSDVDEFAGATGVGGMPGFLEAGSDEGKEKFRGKVIPGAKDIGFLRW